MRLKVGDRVKVKKYLATMPADVKVGDILTVKYINHGPMGEYINCTEKLTSGNWGVDNFELYNILKPGLYFKKNNSIFIVAQSVNQLWLVDLSTGIAEWLSKAEIVSSTSGLESRGYSQVELSKEVFTVIARVNS